MTYEYFPLYLLALIMTFALTVVIEKCLIPNLTGRAKQPIYEDGPKWHLSKSGTPTMGGLAFIIASSISLFVAASFLYLKGERGYATSLIISAVFALANALVGIFDDLTKLRRQKNGGLTPLQKLGLQLVLAVLYLTFMARFSGLSTEIDFVFGSIELGIFYYPISIFIILGIINCANLTDGIDGLASSVAFCVGVVFFYLSAASLPEIATLASVLIGAAIGFLIFNINPAKIFMGDTGSLFLGAMAVCCAFLFENPFIIVAVGGVYVIEGISVVIQVISYKLTKKRIFKMAPLHHHLEKCGFGENKICVIAIAVTLLLSLFCRFFMR